MENKLVVFVVLALVLAAGYFVLSNVQDEPDDQRNVEVRDIPLDIVEEPTVPDPSNSTGVSGIAPSKASKSVPAQVGPKDQLMGKVTTKSGEPIVAASVTIFRYSYVQPPRTGRLLNQHEEIVQEKVATDKDGRYLFADLSQTPGPYFSMRIEKEGFSEVLKDAVGAGMIVDAKLESGDVIRGRLVDAVTMKPIVGQVFCDWSMMAPGKSLHEYRRWRRRFHSNSDGTFVISGVPRGEITAYFEHGAYQWLYLKPDNSFWASADRSEEMVFKMLPGFTLKGKVVDAVSGQPVDKCSVTMKEYIVPSRREITGVFGKFGFSGLNQGRFEMVLSADGYTQMPLMLEVNKESMAKEKVFRLEPAGFASGVALDPDGKPIPGARIFVAKSIDIFRNIRGGVETRADADGLYTVANLNAGKVYRIAVVADGYCIAVSEDFKAVSGEYVDGILVQVSNGATLRGIVVDQSEVPIKGVLVTLEAPPFRDAWFPPGTGAGQKHTETVATDENGFWEFKGLWPGPHDLSMSHPKYVPVAPSKVRIEKYNDRIDQPISLTKGRTIEGYVRDENGQPMGDVVITASLGKFRMRSVSTKTKADGTYELVQLLDAGYRVKAMGPNGIAPVQNDVQSDSKAVDFVLQSYGSIEGAVMAYQAATPIDKFHIRVSPMHDLPVDDKKKIDMNSRMAEKLMQINESYVDRTMVAPDGRFRIDNLEPGNYIVEVESEDRVSVRHVAVVVQPSSITTVKTFILREGARIEGFLKDSEGQPINPTTVKVRIVPAVNSTLETTVGPGGKKLMQQGRSPWKARELHLNKDGFYGAGGLPPGRVTIQITSPAYCVPEYLTVTCGKSGLIRKDFTLVRGAKVIIHVQDLEGDPVRIPSALIFNSDKTTAKVDGRRAMASGGINGKLTIPKLAPGSYSVEVKSFGYRHERLDFDVVAGETKILSARLEKLR